MQLEPALFDTYPGGGIGLQVVELESDVSLHGLIMPILLIFMPLSSGVFPVRRRHQSNSSALLGWHNPKVVAASWILTRNRAWPQFRRNNALTTRVHTSHTFSLKNKIA